MTITDAMIEAAARALCLHANLKPDFKAPADVYGMDGEDENGAGWRYQWRMFAERTKLALEAAERAAWVAPSEMAETKELLVYMPKARMKVQSAKRLSSDTLAIGGAFSFDMPAVSLVRPLPTPGEPDER